MTVGDKETVRDGLVHRVLFVRERERLNCDDPEGAIQKATNTKVRSDQRVTVLILSSASSNTSNRHTNLNSRPYLNLILL